MSRSMHRGASGRSPARRRVNAGKRAGVEKADSLPGPELLGAASGWYNEDVLAAVVGGIGELAMKKIVITPAVKVALRTLDDDTRRRVDSWLTRLANWDGDEFVRRHSQSLDSPPGVFVLKTSTDLRIFFTIQGNTVTILDIGKEQSILLSGHLPGAE
jgi:mRNA-degrading endonuclease RelE of RelBE toxin-antitoxin system